MEWYTVLPIVTAVGGFAVSYLAFVSSVWSVRKREAQNFGKVLSELEYVKAGIDELKEQNRNEAAELAHVSERLTRVEESAKHAHKRLDGHDVSFHRTRDGGAVS